MKPKRSREKHRQDVSNKTLLNGLVILMLAGCILGWLIGPAWAADLQGTGWTVQGQGDSETAQPASQTQPMTEGEAQGQPEQLGDIQEEEPTFLDPESIPDSVPVPMADWVFEVPVDVKNLPDEVQKIMVICRVFVFNDGRNHKIGENGKIVQISDGSCQKNVLIGLDYQRPDGFSADWLPGNNLSYGCLMYLRGPGPDYRWAVPWDEKVTPPWRRADPDQPFRKYVDDTIR